MTRWIPAVFLLLAVVLLGAAVIAYCLLPVDAPGASLDQADLEFPALAVGENKSVVRIHNPTRHPVRIVGGYQC